MRPATSASTRALDAATVASLKFVQGHAIYNRQKVNEANLNAAKAFLAECGTPDLSAKPPFFWSDVEGREVVRLLESLEFPQEVQPLWKLDGRRSLLTDYISDRLSEELQFWDVCLATRSREGELPVKDFLPGHKLHPVDRNSADIRGKTVYRFAAKKNAVGDQDTPKLGLNDAELDLAERLPVSLTENKFCKVRRKPLLIFFLVNVRSGLDEIDIVGPAFSIALCLPPTTRPVREQTYQINKVLREQMLRESEQNAEDDDAILGEAA